MRTFPSKVGDKVKLRKVGPHWYTYLIDNANKLTKGKVYTVSYFREWSSWTEIRFKETGDLEYNHTWFDVVK